MAKPTLITRVKAIFRAWPVPGAVLLLLAFLITAAWFVNIAVLTFQTDAEKWLEPLAALFTGAGAFLVVWILIGERVQSAAIDASVYGLARGLATGYYFNLIQPLIGVMRDTTSSLYAEAAKAGATQIGGLVVGIPQSPDQFEPGGHANLLKSIVLGGLPFMLHDITVKVEGRPRPIFVRLAVSTHSKVGIVVDIPTTLTVVPNFAEFVANAEAKARGNDDERLSAARADAIITSETADFERRLFEEFQAVAIKFATQEPRERSPLPLLHVVPMPLLRRRMEEVARH